VKLEKLKRYLNGHIINISFTLLSFVFVVLYLFVGIMNPITVVCFFLIGILVMSSILHTFFKEGNIGTTIFYMAFTAVSIVIVFSFIYVETGIMYNNVISHNNLDTLYFSAVTWTTLGYGDFQPVKAARLLAASEAFLGYVFMGVFIGIVLTYANNKKDKKEYIAKQLEDLEDFSFFDTKELVIKKIGILKRLNIVKVHQINITNLVLHGAKIKNLRFISSELIGFKLSNGRLDTVHFHCCNIRSSKFKKTKIVNGRFYDCVLLNATFLDGDLSGTNFEKANLTKVIFDNAILKSAIFKGANLSEASYSNAVLDSANFIGAQKLDVMALIKAKSLNYIKAEQDVLTKVIALRNDVKLDIRNKDGRWGIEPPT